MRRNEIDSLEMIESVIAFLEGNIELIENNPAITAKLTELKAHAATVKAMKPVQVERGKEDHAVKKTNRETLVELIKSTTDGLKAVAVSTNNTALKTVCNYPQSSLKDMRENDLVNLAMQLVAKAKEYEVELKTYHARHPPRYRPRPDPSRLRRQHYGAYQYPESPAAVCDCPLQDILRP